MQDACCWWALTRQSTDYENKCSCRFRLLLAGSDPTNRTSKQQPMCSTDCLSQDILVHLPIKSHQWFTCFKHQHICPILCTCEQERQGAHETDSMKMWRVDAIGITNIKGTPMTPANRPRESPSLISTPFPTSLVSILRKSQLRINFDYLEIFNVYPRHWHTGFLKFSLLTECGRPRLGFHPVTSCLAARH